MALTPYSRVPLWRSYTFNIALALWTAIIGSIYAPRAILSSHGAGKVNPPFTKGALWLAEKICGQTYELRGQENIIMQHMMIAAKHQSAFEIIVLLHHFPDGRFILKKELLWIPIFGQYLWRMGMVPIKRSKRSKLLDDIVRAAKVLAHQRRPIIIFPEGTRVKAGETGKYQPGVGVIYDQLKLPILPVAVNTGIYWPKKRTEKRAGKAVIEFLPVIEPGLGLRDCMEQLKSEVENASARLYKEAMDNINNESNA